MAYSSLLSFSVCFLVLFHGCFAQIDLVTNRGQSQQSQQRKQNQCQLQNLNALQPKHRFKSEAGVTEFWDQNEDQFQCAGVAFLRHTIQRKGLLLPSFNNAPQLIYVVEGQGVQGAIIPGCPETYQSQSQQSQSRKAKQQSFRDQHQKLRRMKEGDIFALPAGLAHWIHNDGQSPLVLVSLVDVGNNDNQLDQNFRKFFLAGNPQEGLVTGGQRQNKDRSQSQRGEQEEQQRSEGNSLFFGFHEKYLAEAFRIDTKLARKLQNEKDNRGAIVRMEHGITTPEEMEEEQRQQGREEEEEEEEEEEQRQQGSEEEEEEEEQEDEEAEGSEEERQRRERRQRQQRRQGRKGENGLEETFCSMRLRHRTDSSFADVVNPRAGRITSINSYKFPVLRVIQLSAERGVLCRDAIYTPHWNINAHSVVFITRGSGRMQIVEANGNTIFNDEVKKGQVIVIPQNFAVVKKAGNEGLEWIAFKTNANAKVSQIAGRVSVFRGMPVDVIANAYDISREEAMRLKQSRQVSLVSSRQGSQQ